MSGEPKSKAARFGGGGIGARRAHNHRGDEPPEVTATVVNDDQVLLLGAGGTITFGRDPTADIRIGHAPIYDDVVPRQAGSVFGIGRRVVVSNLAGHIAFDISTDDRPPMVVRPGDWFSPPHHRFDVVVHGGAFQYPITVTVNSAGAPARLALDDDELKLTEPMTGARPDLTERQRRVIDLYTAPVRQGLRPASHQEVADHLGISRSLVRLECHRIWSELLVTGVPMRDLPDMRDAVVDAWTRHRF